MHNPLPRILNSFSQITEERKYPGNLEKPFQSEDTKSFKQRNYFPMYEARPNQRALEYNLKPEVKVRKPTNCFKEERIHQYPKLYSRDENIKYRYPCNTENTDHINQRYPDYDIDEDHIRNEDYIHHQPPYWSSHHKMNKQKQISKKNYQTQLDNNRNSKWEFTQFKIKPANIDNRERTEDKLLLLSDEKFDGRPSMRRSETVSGNPFENGLVCTNNVIMIHATFQFYRRRLQLRLCRDFKSRFK